MGAVAWRIHHSRETVSTNIDAANGLHGDVYTADWQSGGRGRLDHRWFSPPGVNLLMSAVLSVEGVSDIDVATFPLVVGLAVARAVEPFSRRFSGAGPKVKWPNDVLVDGRKVAGILCERHGGVVAAGVGVNVRRQSFPREIAARAAFLGDVQVEEVRDRVLEELAECWGKWRESGFAAIFPEVFALDFLKGKHVCVRQTDGDSSPVSGLSNGIMCDGSLDVGGVRVYAGEAHVEGAAFMNMEGWKE